MTRRALIEQRPQRWNKDRYCTPSWIMDLVYEYFESHPELDPCWDPDSIVEAGRKVDFRKGDCGLSIDWRPFETVWMNCPYSEPTPWVAKATAMVARAITRMDTLAILPTSPATKWWQAGIAQNELMLGILLLGPRRVSFLKQGNPERNTRGEHSIVLWSSVTVESDREKKAARFRRIFGPHGMCVTRSHGDLRAA